MIGRMFFVGLYTNDLSIIKRLIQECHVVGILLYSKNYKSYEEMIELINHIHAFAEEVHYSILVGIDQEGYRVNWLPKEFKNLKSPFSFHEDVTAIQKHGEIIANILSESNININFAPVLDIKRFPSNHPIGDRSFGEDAQTVIKNTIPYIDEFTKKNVISVVKHFPGHGATKINSHYFLPIIWNTKRLFKEDVLPFIEAIHHQIDVVMIGHFIIPKFSFFEPVSINKKMIQFLRNDLNFKQVIMTDDLAMGPLKLCNKVRLFKKAINHGVNIIMVKYYDRFFDDFHKLEKIKGLNKENIANANDLVEQLIIKYQINNHFVFNHLNVSKINEEITELNKLAK